MGVPTAEETQSSKISSTAAETQDTSAITPGQKFEGHTSRVWGVIHLPGGQRIVTCSSDGSLRVWDLKSREQIGERWRDGVSPVYTIALSPDGTKVASGSEDGAVRLWSIETGKVIAKWTGHTQSVCSVCWSQDGQRVLSGSSDGTARQWDVEKGEIILTPIETGHTHVGTVVYSPDAAMFATAGYHVTEPSVKIWDAKTGKLVTALEGHTRSVYCLAWAADGKTLISGSVDRSIRTWDTATWKEATCLDVHTSFVRAIAISPDGRILASASYDGTVRLWNLGKGQAISSPLKHADRLTCVSFSADGKLLATGCYDHNMYTSDVSALLEGDTGRSD
ncbi:WD40 repeat-like protein [Suillus decipiens]|nr:WD40 repeat-like protein [Suillus decipiens]